MTTSVAELVSLFIGALLVHNTLLVQRLGIAPPAGYDPPPRLRLVVAATIVTTTIVGWMLYQHVLTELNLKHLDLPLYALLIGAAGMSAGRAFRLRGHIEAPIPALIPTLIGANSAALGVALSAVTVHDQWSGMLVSALGAAFGVVLATTLLAAHADRLSAATIPAPLRGAPITLITVGIASVALVGLLGIGR